MRKKAISMILAAALGSALLAGCSSAPKETTAAATTAETTAEEKKEESKAEETKAEEKKEEAAGNDMLSGETGDIAKAGDGKGQKIVLITIDSMDQHWVNMDKGCKQAAEELGCDYKWIAPDVKDDAKQIECVNNAVAYGANEILVDANGPDHIKAAL